MRSRRPRARLALMPSALANHATVAESGDGVDVSFVIRGKYKMTGHLNARGEVDRVQTWIDQSIVGDMVVATEYSDYKDFPSTALGAGGGVRFPSHIVQKQDGFPALDLTVTKVQANVPVNITVPAGAAPSPQGIEVKTQWLADGVFWLTGGTHHSLAIEMKDHIVLVDTPNSEARAFAVLAKAKEMIPGKPVRYVVAMHHHWDHMGGIRTAIDEGATIVTHESNRALLERAASAPHTITPDRLARSRKPLKLQTVDAEGQLTVRVHSGIGRADLVGYRVRDAGHTAQSRRRRDVAGGPAEPRVRLVLYGVRRRLADREHDDRASVRPLDSGGDRVFRHCPAHVTPPVHDGGAYASTRWRNVSRAGCRAVLHPRVGQRLFLGKRGCPKSAASACTEVPARSA